MFDRVLNTHLEDPKSPSKTGYFTELCKRWTPIANKLVTFHKLYLLSYRNCYHFFVFIMHIANYLFLILLFRMILFVNKQLKKVLTHFMLQIFFYTWENWKHEKTEKMIKPVIKELRLNFDCLEIINMSS